MCVYNTTHPITVKASEIGRSTAGCVAMAKQRRRGPLPSDKTDFVYGLPTRPSTPVARLMTDVYQKLWLAEAARAKTDRENAQKVPLSNPGAQAQEARPEEGRCALGTAHQAKEA